MKIVHFLLYYQMKVSIEQMKVSIVKRIPPIILCLFTAVQPFVLKAQVPIDDLIPRPKRIEKAEGAFLIPEQIVIGARAREEIHAAKVLQQYLEKITFKGVPVVATQGMHTINFFLNRATSNLHAEYYSVTVNPGGISISAPTEIGLTNGALTVAQLLLKAKEQSSSLSCGIIFDFPTFSWRGMHLDESRHFFGKGFVKKYLDMLALCKINMFHWHLTDDAGWRIEIKQYPLLTQIGAWRDDLRQFPWNYYNFSLTGTNVLPYGGFYTQEDIKEIVAYAAERNITIVPEIDMPGHAAAALYAYPWLSCTGKPWQLNNENPFEFSDPLCICDTQVLVFCRDVLKEISNIFPGSYIHVGGDECKQSHWLKFKKCMEVMKENGFDSPAELQHWFTRYLEQFLLKEGKTMIGWDEILGGPLEKTTTIMLWRSKAMEENLKKAKALTTPIVLVPNNYFYFDNPAEQTRSKSLGSKRTINLKEVYDFMPTDTAGILGLQACLWTEHCQTTSMAEHLTFPRLFALAENAWSGHEGKDAFEKFLHRVESFYPVLDRLAYRYGLPGINTTAIDQIFIDSIEVKLNKAYPTGTIYYTLDGTEPTQQSFLYTKPFFIHRSTTLKAIVYYASKHKSDIQTIRYQKTEPLPALKFKPTHQGLNYIYLEGTISDISSQWSQLKVKSKGVVPNITIPGFARADHWAMQWNGYLYIPKTGVYTFTLASDDGSILWIDGHEIINYDGIHGAVGKSNATALEKGFHAFTLKYFEHRFGQSIRLLWSSDEIETNPIPDSVFYR